MMQFRNKGENDNFDDNTSTMRMLDNSRRNLRPGTPQYIQAKTGLLFSQNSVSAYVKSSGIHQRRVIARRELSKEAIRIP